MKTEIQKLLQKPAVNGYTIGGSEIAAVCGISQYATPFDVFVRKVNGEQVKENERMALGKYLEGGVVQTLEKYYNYKICARQYRVAPNRYRATIDGLIVDKSVDGDIYKLLEIKTTGSYISEDKVPNEYLMQVQWYMGLLNYDGMYEVNTASLVFLDASMSLNFFDVEYKEEMFYHMLKLADEFYDKYLATGTPPPNPANIEVKQGCIVADNDLNSLILKYNEISNEIKEKESEKELIKSAIIAKMQGVEEVVYSGGKVLYKKYIGEYVNKDKAKELLGERFGEVVDKKEYFQFRVIKSKTKV